MKFVYEGYKLIEELDGINNNAVLRRYVWQPLEVGSDVPLSVFDAALGATYYYHTDGNKNVIAMTDSNGAKVASYTYDAFGNVTSRTGSYAATNPFRFSSEYLDTETGLIYYNYRYYHPQFGRWLTRDPIGELGGVNLYGMCKNNTIYSYDKLGLSFWCKLKELWDALWTGGQAAAPTGLAEAVGATDAVAEIGQNLSNFNAQDALKKALSIGDKDLIDDAEKLVDLFNKANNNGETNNKEVWEKAKELQRKIQERQNNM